MLKNMTIENIIKVTQGEYFGDKTIMNRCIEGADLDSRKIESGYLFIATKGERVDGHNFIVDVIKKGALVAVGENDYITDYGNYIKVKSSFQALKDIAEFYRENLDIKVVGITGSVGKTGTKEAIAAVLSSHYDVLKTAGNFNNEVGLPLTVLRIRDNTQIAVLEMGISDFGEMRRLSKIAKPDICVMTNIGMCHLENLKTQDGIYEAKSEIFEHMNPNGAIVLNGDDPILSKKENISGIKPVFFGTKSSEDMYVKEVDNKGLLGSEFTLAYKDGEIKAVTKLPGVHTVLNCSAAALVGKLLGLSDDEITDGIKNIEGLGGRSNIINTQDYMLIDDCYNANPVSMKEAIDLLMMANGRKIAVLGDMFELGDNSSKMHYGVGEYVAKNKPDVLLLAGSNSKDIYKGAVDKGYSGEIKHFINTEELLADIKNYIKKGDCILLKASHGMHFEKVVNYLVNVNG